MGFNLKVLSKSHYSKFIMFNFIQELFLSLLDFSVNLGNVNEVCSDAAERWQMSFQDPASPIMEGIEHFHNDLMFFIVIIFVFVSWLLFLQLFSTNNCFDVKTAVDYLSNSFKKNNYKYVLYLFILICFFCILSPLFIFVISSFSKEQFQIFLLLQFLVFLTNVWQTWLKKSTNKCLVNRKKTVVVNNKRFYSTVLIKELGLWKSLGFILRSNSYHWLGEKYPLLWRWAHLLFVPHLYTLKFDTSNSLLSPFNQWGFLNYAVLLLFFLYVVWFFFDMYTFSHTWQKGSLIKKEAAKAGVRLHPDAVQAGLVWTCVKGTCGFVVAGFGTGVAIDTMQEYRCPEGGFESKPFKHVIQWLSVTSGSVKFSPLMTYHWPKFPMQAIDGELVKVEGSFFLKKNGMIYSCENGQYRGAHQIEPVFTRTVATSPPVIAGVKVPTLGLTVVNPGFDIASFVPFEKTGVPVEKTTGVPEKSFIYRTPLPLSGFLDEKATVFSRLHDEDIVKLLNSSDNTLVKKIPTSQFSSFKEFGVDDIDLS